MVFNTYRVFHKEWQKVKLGCILKSTFRGDFVHFICSSAGVKNCQFYLKIVQNGPKLFKIIQITPNYAKLPKVTHNVQKLSSLAILNYFELFWVILGHFEPIWAIFLNCT